jgi:uncharacterized protein (TIGR02246 family)
MTAATSATDEQAVRAALAEIDAGYAEGDAGRIMDHVADDARLSFVNTPTIEGREALGAYLGRLFASYDMSTHRASYADVEIHGHHAYAIGEYAVVHRPHDGGPASEIEGRVVYVLRREDGGAWRVRRFLNQYSRPPHEVA